MLEELRVVFAALGFKYTMTEEGVLYAEYFGTSNAVPEIGFSCLILDGMINNAWALTGGNPIMRWDDGCFTVDNFLGFLSQYMSRSTIAPALTTLMRTRKINNVLKCDSTPN